MRPALLLQISWQSHNNIYLGAHALRALPSAYNLSYLWNEYNHQELLFYGSTATDQRSTTLWRLGNAFLRQGYELHHRHGALVEQLGELSLSDQFRCVRHAAHPGRTQPVAQATATDSTGRPTVTA